MWVRAKFGVRVMVIVSVVVRISFRARVRV